MVLPFLDAEGTQSAGSSQTFQVTTAAGDVQLVWAQPTAQLLSFRAAIKVGDATTNPSNASPLVAVGERCRLLWRHLCGRRGRRPCEHAALPQP